MCSGLHGNKTTRYLLKYLLHRFRCRRHFLFQKDFTRFIQNAVTRPAIAEVHTNRELVSFENHVSIYANSANLFHCRSPFYCASSTSNIGSVSHPAGDRPSHPISPFRAFGPRNPMKVVSVTVLFSARGPLFSTLINAAVPGQLFFRATTAFVRR